MSAKEKSQRQLQASQQIKKIIADIFMRGGFSQIGGGYITILEADISPDFKNCKIYIDIFGDVDKGEIIKKLNLKTNEFKHQLAQKLTLRIAPQIKFFLDETSQNALELEDLLKKEAKNFEE